MNSATIFFALAAVVASASAGAGIGLANDIYAYPAYRTTYSVADKVTGDQKSATEVRDGGITKGSYSLVQPDGVLRTVNYIVTPHGGFQAQVINKGAAAHPAVYGKGALGGIGLGGVGVGLGGIGVGLGGIGARSVVGGLGLGVPVGGLGIGGIGLGGLGGIGLGLGGLGGGIIG